MKSLKSFLRLSGNSITTLNDWAPLTHKYILSKPNHQFGLIDFEIEEY